MDPKLGLLIGAGLVKICSVGWLISIATSPVAAPSRRRFLEVNKEGLENLVKLGLGPDEARLTQLRKNFELLEANVERGWDDPQVFAAAYQVSTWKFYEHACGAVMGASRLATHALLLAKQKAYAWVDTIFAPPQQTPPE